MSHSILAKVAGGQISQVIKGLPDPADDHRDTRPVTIEVPHVGRVQIIFVRKLARHGKSSHWFWCADSADREADLRIGESEGDGASQNYPAATV